MRHLSKSLSPRSLRNSHHPSGPMSTRPTLVKTAGSQLQCCSPECAAPTTTSFQLCGFRRAGVFPIPPPDIIFNDHYSADGEGHSTVAKG
jgi:hypothetical protein